MKSPNILIIDDDTIFSSDLVFFLDSNFHFRTAENSMEAIEIIRDDMMDLVVLDIVLPAYFATSDDEEGIELLKRLRDPGYNPNPHIPIIMLSVMTDGHTMTECKKCKADAYFHKPPELENLINKINSVLIKAERGELA